MVDLDGSCLHELDFLDQTANLILELHLRDIEELLSTSKGKGREGEHSDADLALLIYQHELEERDAIIADRRMARSHSRAVLSDSATVTKLVTENDVATRDRAMALEISGTGATSAAIEQKAVNGALDEGILGRLAALYVSGRNDDCDPLETTSLASDPAGEESSTWASSSKTASIMTRHKCSACDAERPYYDVYQTPCGHHYCQDCLNTLFELSTTDETLYPPRCCRQQIPLASAKLYLNSALICAFEQKSIEYKSWDRTYCSQPTCSSFITSATITSERATCTVCSTITCTICKSRAHNGDCPEDTATQQVLETAREEGWKRCYNCGRLVELDIGCNHMICPCKAEFCYGCGERWKTCGCDQWQENRLVARANQVVDRGLPRGGVFREQQVTRAVEQLRERHNCDHSNWRYVSGPCQCEQCYDNLPSYIFECTQCRILACNRCRRNRL